MKLPKVKIEIISTEVAGGYQIVNLKTGIVYEATKEIVLFLDLFKEYNTIDEIIPSLIPLYGSPEEIKKRVEEATQIFNNFNVLE